MTPRALRVGLLSILCIVLGLPAGAVDLDNLPDWVRVSVSAVHIDWAQVYPGLGLPPGVTIGTVSTAGAPTGVHGVAPLSSLGSVSLATSDSGVSVAQPARTDGSVLAATLRSLIDQGRLTEDGVSGYCAEHGIADDTIIRALDSLELSHPMKSPYLGLCAALWDRLGEDVDACLELPYAPRIYMATYLGVLERENDAKTLLSSLENPDRLALGAELYHVACELLGFQECALPLAIWCYKRGATMRGPADQAFVCFHIRQACQKLADPVVVREELIPWAQAVLASAGATTARHEYALRELVWAYEYLGQTGTAISQARQWIDRFGDVDASYTVPLYPALELAHAYREQGQADEAAAMLRLSLTSAAPDSVLANRAQAELAALAEEFPELGHLAVLPPMFSALSAERIDVTARMGQAATRSVIVSGNATFAILDLSATIGSASIQQSLLEASGVQRFVVELRTEPMDEMGLVEGLLRLATNDPETPHVEIPVRLEVVSPITVSPETLFFGVVRRGDVGDASARIRSAVPIEFVAVRCDRPVSVQVSQEEPGQLRVTARLDATGRTGALEGTVELAVRAGSEISVAVPYRAQIIDR